MNWYDQQKLPKLVMPKMYANIGVELTTKWNDKMIIGKMMRIEMLALSVRILMPMYNYSIDFNLNIKYTNIRDNEIGKKLPFL